MLRLDCAASSLIGSRLSLAGAILIYFVLTALSSSRRLWHDELYTLYIATAPTLSRLWQEIHLDLNPPLEYLCVRLSSELFGQSGYAIRLPSILSFLAGSLCLYKFVANRLPAAYGLLAMLVLWASPFFYYATEARPYALALGFLGVTLLRWQHAIREERSRLSVLLLGLAVSSMMLSHLMAVVYVAPFCAAELARALRRRKIDWAVGAALTLPCAIPFIYLRLMARVGSSSFPPVFRASWRKIAESFYGTLKLEALPLLLALGLAWAIGSREKNVDRPKHRIGRVDLALVAGFLAMPVLINLLLMRVGGAYFDRYAFPVEFGYALAIAFFVAAQTGRSRLAPYAAAAALLAFFCALNVRPLLKQSVWGRRGEQIAGDDLRKVRPDLPLVAASGLTFIELDHYGDPQTVGRLFYLTDRSLALRYARATIFEGMPALKEFFPIRAGVAPFAKFVEDHKTFLVLGTPDYPEDWLLRALVDRRADVRYAGESPGPYKDKQLYIVTIPGVAAPAL